MDKVKQSHPSFLVLFGQFRPLGQFHQFGDVEAVHVVDVWVDPSGLFEVDMVPLLNELDQALFAYLDVTVHYLYVPLLQGVVDHFFVLKRRDGAGGVDHCAADTHAIYGSQDQLLLHVGVLVDVEQ